MNIKILLLSLATMPLMTLAAEQRVFHPQIFEDGGNQWITDAFKWNIEQVRVRLIAWYNDAVGQMNDRQKNEIAPLLAKINEISDWLRDKTPEQRARWQIEFANKVRELKNLFGIGSFGIHSMHNLSQPQQREFNLLKGHVGMFDAGSSNAFHTESIEQIRELLHLHRTFNQ